MLKKRFTKWFVRKGYRFSYDEQGRTVFMCPIWVKPFLVLFSPSVYMHIVGIEAGRALQEGIKAGLAGGKEANHETDRR